MPCRKAFHFQLRSLLTDKHFLCKPQTTRRTTPVSPTIRKLSRLCLAFYGDNQVGAAITVVAIIHTNNQNATRKSGATLRARRRIRFNFTVNLPAIKVIIIITRAQDTHPVMHIYLKKRRRVSFWYVFDSLCDRYMHWEENHYVYKKQQLHFICRGTLAIEVS